MANPPFNNPPRHRGLSLIELLVALSITAMLLTATMLAIDASFKAYAEATETASTQTTTRLVTNRVLSLIRTGTALAPLQPDLAEGVTLNDQTLASPYIKMFNSHDTLIRIDYDADTDRLMLRRDVNNDGKFDSDEKPTPLLGGVTQCGFRLHRRLDSENVLVLDRASIDFTVVADDDATLELEDDNSRPLRVVASTMPRKLE